MARSLSGLFGLLAICLTADIVSGICPGFKNCTCYEGAVDQTKTICNNMPNLHDFPPGLISAHEMTFKNVSIDVIKQVPYDKTVIFLYIVKAGVKFVHDGAFKDLTMLQSLHLQHNEITSIRAAMFQGLKNLKNLNLSYNPIYHLRAQTLTGANLPSLGSLTLDKCELYVVEDKALDSLSNLTILTMAKNHLTSLPVLGCSDNPLTKLQTWWLNNNGIEYVPRLECSAPKFKTLELSYNNIEILNASFLGPIARTLSTLRLGHNQISVVHDQAFKEFTSLHVLDLSYNELKIMSNEAIPWNMTKTVLIHDNPWDCSCVTQWLVDEVPIATYNNQSTVRCASPEEWANMSVTSVDEDVFKYCDKPHHQTGHVIGIVMGTIFGLIALIACFVFVYRKTARRRAADNNNAAAAPISSPRNISSSYRRMADDNDVTFGYKSDRDRQQTSAYWENNDDDPFSIG